MSMYTYNAYHNTYIIVNIREIEFVLSVGQLLSILPHVIMNIRLIHFSLKVILYN